MPIDLLDSSGLWIWGDDTGPVPPPPTPAPATDTGDGVALPGMLSENYISTQHYARTYEVPKRENPWVELLRWMRRLNRIDAQWQIAEIAKRIEADDLDVMQLTGLTRRH